MNERQEHIMDAATALFLKEGVSVSTAKIAQASGISNGSLFNAFATKQDLIDAIYRTAKTGMFDALPHARNVPFDRAHLYDNWQGYIAWARANGPKCDIMHLLLEAGLASPEVTAEIDAMAAPHFIWINTALDHGTIRGPSVTFIGKLVFFYLDLVISENLNVTQADLAFDMLCNAIGLTT